MSRTQDFRGNDRFDRLVGRNGTRHKRRGIAIHYAGAKDRYLANRWTKFEGLHEGDPLEAVLPLASRARGEPTPRPAG